MITQDHSIISPYKGYTYGTLRTAFERVQDKKDWKNPICAVIKAEEKELISAAIEFFTATEPVFFYIRHPITGAIIPDCVIVNALGYRLGPAGDH